MFIVDAHLDLAYNASLGRDVAAPAEKQKPDMLGTPAVGLPDLVTGGAGLVCATIFCEPAIRDPNCGYKSPREAYEQGMWQVRWYHEQVAAGRMRLVRTKQDMTQLTMPGATGGLSASVLLGDTGRQAARGTQDNSHAAVKPLLSDGPGRAVPAILLLEGADALGSEEDVRVWFEAGLRIVALAWNRTRHAGGTGAPGPLTDEGRAIVRVLDRFGIIHDISHLAEESFWQLLDLSDGPVIASHSNCRRFIPTDRQLSDEMIRAITARGGIIGINFFDKFLVPPDEYGKRRAMLSDIVPHIRHICQIAGDADHVGLGTDIDGGFGREKLPVEITTWADMLRVADTLFAAGFSDDQIQRIMGGNWARFFENNLPVAPGRDQ